jgi:hypothetical protein
MVPGSFLFAAKRSAPSIVGVLPRPSGWLAVAYLLPARNFSRKHMYSAQKPWPTGPGLLSPPVSYPTPPPIFLFMRGPLLRLLADNCEGRINEWRG